MKKDKLTQLHELSKSGLTDFVILQVRQHIQADPWITVSGNTFNMLRDFDMDWKHSSFSFEDGKGAMNIGRISLDRYAQPALIKIAFDFDGMSARIANVAEWVASRPIVYYKSVPIDQEIYQKFLKEIGQKNEPRKEIERKFLIEDGVNAETLAKVHKTERITQAYIQVGDVERRVRSKGGKYIETIKYKASENGLIRPETNNYISELEFKENVKNCIGNVIKKTRVEVPLQDGLTAELDVYSGELKGLVVVEVEFLTKQAANDFVVPSWFGVEVTSDKAYKNQSLALHGLPQGKL